MRFSKYILFLSYIILLYANCVKEFNPQSQDYENLLVVEAFLTDGNEPFEVILSRSIRIDTSVFLAESGASVWLTDETGENINLNENGTSGHYFHDGIIPQVGTEYQLHIKTVNGSEYESSKVAMRSTPEIDSVNFKFEERPTADLMGIQIYVNTHDDLNNTWYYRWEWNETWEFYTPYASDHIFENDQILPREDNINRCWKHSGSTSIEIASSKNLIKDIISEFPLHYVSTNTDRLGLKYSINIKQFSLSEESYNYWVELQKTTESLGTLFDPQPSTVFGNIYNVNNDNEVVLGYFDAAAKSEKRIFIKRSDLPRIQTANYYYHCEDSIVAPSMVKELVQQGWMLAYEIQDDFGNFMYLLSYPSCVDCRTAGTNQKPDFWQ